MTILVLVSITFLALDSSGSRSITSGIKTIGSTIMSPVVGLVNAVAHPIGNFFAGAFDYGSVVQENEKLRAQIGRLHEVAAQRAYDRGQLAQVLALEHLSFVGSLPTVIAETNDISLSNFSATITISKGTAEGVAVGMPVVGAGGLVGQVIDTTSGTSTVRLVTDGRSRIGGVFGSSSQLGIVNGTGAGDPLSVSYVPPGSKVAIGTEVLTNGLQGAQYPAGIPIGRVRSASSPVTATQMAISLRPAADLNQLHYVDVILWEPPA